MIDVLPVVIVPSVDLNSCVEDRLALFILHQPFDT